MSEKRYLTQKEIALLESVYGKRDYFNKTTIERGNFYVFPSFGMVSNNNIKVGRTVYSNDFSVTHPSWFIHEGAHLVQEQSFGRHLFGSKLGDKARSLFSNNYQYADDVKKGVPFEKMAIEAQASMISDYFRVTQGHPGRYATFPIDVYRDTIPAGYVPRFGREKGKDWQEPPAAHELERSGHNETITPVTGAGKSQRQPQKAPVPRPRPDQAEQAVGVPSSKPSPNGSEAIDPGKTLPRPKAKPTRNRAESNRIQSGEINPFQLDRPSLEHQAMLLDRNPAKAKQLILQAGRDPKLFGLAA